MPELDPKKSARAFYARSLARERARAGLTQAALGAHPAVMVSGKLVGHIENCRRPPTLRISRAFDRALNLEEHFEGLYALMVREEGEPPAIYEYYDLEDQASSIKAYDSLWINGLLQTEETAREILRAGQGEDRLEELVAARMERQAILRRETPPWLMVAMDEFVLRRIVGSRDVTRRQLEHLLTVMEESDVSIVIVPRDAPIHPSGSFTLLELPDGLNVGYVEGAAGQGRLLGPGQPVRNLGLLLDRIASTALPVTDSEKLIRSALEDL
ncbi:helix-turn-helix domain-containing protein [Thermomonospora amylolytica]|uniref:helix-turn-helix domain-containing protein n=1 Tax=Thermomonospora amylolytica TaxID=1411117 RepID=UPI000E6C8D70|nr:helix-turn-helix transcriptional regulator [Thermomonospora amylolytica]